MFYDDVIAQNRRTPWLYCALIPAAMWTELLIRCTQQRCSKGMYLQWDSHSGGHILPISLVTIGLVVYLLKHANRQEKTLSDKLKKIRKHN